MITSQFLPFGTSLLRARGILVCLFLSHGLVARHFEGLKEERCMKARVMVSKG